MAIDEKKKREIERKCKYWQHRAEAKIQKYKKGVCKLLPDWLRAELRGIYMQMCKHFAPYSRRQRWQRGGATVSQWDEGAEAGTGTGTGN